MRDYIPKVKNGGWHFSYLGGVSRIRQKLHSIIEGKEELATEDYINRCLLEGKDLYGRSGKEFEYDFIDLKELKVDNINDIVQKYPFFIRK